MKDLTQPLSGIAWRRILCGMLSVCIAIILGDSAEGSLIGADVTLEANSTSSQFPVFGPATETVVSPDSEFSFQFMSESDGTLGNLMVNALVDFDSESVTFSFVTTTEGLMVIGFPGQVFSLTGLTWPGMDGEIANVTLLDNSLAGSIFGPAPDPVVTDVGPHSFNIRMPQFNTGPDGTTQSFTLGIEAVHHASSVPEPSSGILLATGLGLAAVRRRRRMQRAF